MVLIGRGQDIDRIHAAFHSVRSTGRSRTVLVEASAGCGKTELLGELVRYVESLGLTVLHTTAIAEERGTPLSVIRSLVNGSPFPDELVRRFHTMGDAAARRIRGDGRDEARRDAAWYELMRTFCTEVRTLARREPVVVAVDDVHHGDADSLRQLLHLARHCCSVPVLLAFTRPLVGEPVGSGFDAELLRQPNLDRVPLARLDVGDITAFLAELGHAGVSADTAERCLEISGGNPLLLRALLSDTWPDSAGSRPSRAPESSHGPPVGPAVAPRAGQEYGRAVVACLDRSGEKVRDVAAGLAVLGGSFSHNLLSRLLDISAAELTENLQALRGAGIVSGTSFQHPAAKRAVLDSLEPSHRLELHQRSAELLHASGAPPALAAEHLHSAGQADGAWAVGVLQQAAEQALLEDVAGRAVSYLELAHSASEDPLLRAEIKIRLGSVARRISVADAERHVDDALRVLRTGRVDPSDAGGLGELLLAHGRLEQARTLLEQGRRPVDGKRIRADEGHDPLARRGAWQVGGRSVRPDPPGPRPPADRAGVLARLGGPASGREARHIAGTEGLLEITQLTDTTFDFVVDAIRTLLGLGAVPRALHWCDTFLGESAVRDAPGWEAAFAAVRAEGALHAGDLAEAERDANRCLALLPERHRSAFEAAAVARLVTVHVARGDHEKAARLLSRPVADSLPDTVHWLHYLRARGLYHLATRQYDSALRDFREVGRVAVRWGTDRPALLPWRTDTAEVLLRLGDREQGHRLATEQLALVQHGAPRIRGISLRLQGLAAKPGARLALLNRAAVELNRADDPLELCRTLFDLADAYRQARQARQAAGVLRRARLLAKSCGLETPRDRIGAHDAPDVPVERLVAEPPGQHSGWGHLSESERRVASLAAGGYTNREISGRLHITMSTVEQHLTRVYRKLNINGRDELISEFRTGVQV
ncbi:LuxR C-terminal-related transcriptional regulator [Streptomyces sp. NPDC001500]